MSLGRSFRPANLADRLCGPFRPVVYWPGQGRRQRPSVSEPGNTFWAAGPGPGGLNR